MAMTPPSVCPLRPAKFRSSQAVHLDVSCCRGDHERHLELPGDADFPSRERSILPWLAGHRPRSRVHSRSRNETESLSHYRDESSEHPCIRAWIYPAKCALVVGGICLFRGFRSLCPTVYQPQEDPMMLHRVVGKKTLPSAYQAITANFFTLTRIAIAGDNGSRS